MGEACAVSPDTPGQDEGGYRGAVDEVLVVPVVHAGPDDDHVAPVTFLAVLAPFAGDLQDGLGVDAGVLLLPFRGEGKLGMIPGRVVAGKSARDAELRHQEIEDRGDHDLALVGGDALHRDLADRIGFPLEAEEDPAGLPLQEGEGGVDRAAVHHVLHLEVPVPLLFAPARAEAAVGDAHRAVLVGDAHAPFRMLEGCRALELGGAHKFALAPDAVLLC